MKVEESKSAFLFKNLLRGLIWFAILITAFIVFEGYIQEYFQHNIDYLKNRPMLIYSIFFGSEIFFGVLPPEVFMLIWYKANVTVSFYVTSLVVLTIISYLSGVIGFFIGKNFSKTPLYKKLHDRYLYQYDIMLKRYGGYLVFVGAVTPVPFSATCMLAGSVDFSTKEFLLICLTRVLRFAVYGWMVWSFPNWFSV